LRGRVEPRQHLLQHVAMEGRVLRQLSAEVFQFRVLLRAMDRDSARSPPGNALFQRRVVERATAPQDKLQRPLLLGRRPQPVRVARAQALGHDYRPSRSVCCSRDTYSCSAQTSSPVNERRCAAACAFIASMRACGSWMVTLRCWCLDVSIPVLCRSSGHEARGLGLSAQAPDASPLGWKPCGWRRAQALFRVRKQRLVERGVALHEVRDAVEVCAFQARLAHSSPRDSWQPTNS